jgi:signal transduction histidine kinase
VRNRAAMGESTTAATDRGRRTRHFAGRLPWESGPVPGEFAASAPIATPPRPRPDPMPPTPPELEELGRRTAGVAHDFNNLLSVILVCAGEIAADAEGAHLERAEEILEAARRGAELSRGLLAARRGAPAAEPGPLAVAEALAGSLKLIERSLGPDIHLRTEMDAVLPRARIAASELERVLLNLAANSREAMPAGGAVTIGAELAAIAPGDPVLGTGWHIRISFTDDGPGMSPEVAGRALEPHFTTKAGPPGTSGLGLAGARTIARAAGGDLRIDSRAGAGTTASIHLPAVDPTGGRLALAGRAG